MAKDSRSAGRKQSGAIGVATNNPVRETDLYPPVKQLLESQGYEVKGEIHQCDVVACRGGESPVVVELKLSMNLQLLLQAVDRCAITDSVYVAVPASTPLLRQDYKRLIKLMRMLGLGLISVDLSATGEAAVMLDPVRYQPRHAKSRTRRLLGEFERRVGDPTRGGTAARRGMMTSYRQRALRIASYLRDHGQSKASAIAAALNEPNARQILYSDVYGWFDRHGQGQYSLSPRGTQELPLWTTTTAVAPHNT